MWGECGSGFDMTHPKGSFVMATVSIPLSDERFALLRTRAELAGLTPEEFLLRRVEQLLEQPDESFRRAADYILQKNAELYRRLA